MKLWQKSPPKSSIRFSETDFFPKGCCESDSSFSLQGANAAPCTPAPRSAGGGVLSCGMRCVVVVRLMWCNSSPSAAFSGDRGIRLAPRLAPAGEENPPQPPRPAGRVANRRTLRFAEGLIDAFFKKAWQKSRMQSHQICHDWLGALLTV
jgi:hypothetical protein